MKNKLMNRSLWLALMVAAVAVVSCSETTEPEDTTPQPGHVYIYAGTGVPGYGAMGQTPSKTQLYWPQDIVFAPDQTPYVLDWNNHRVIRITDDGRFELVVGVASGDFGDPCPDPPAPCVGVETTNAKLNHPTHVAFDGTGGMILSAWHNSALFRVNLAAQTMDRICGNGARSYNGDNLPAQTALLDLPVSVLFDASGEMIICDQANQLIRKIDDTGVIRNIAGVAPIHNGTTWVHQAGYSGDGGPAVDAKFSFNRGQNADPDGKLCFDPFGNLYVADTQNHVVRVIDTNGIINTFAGTGLTAGYAGNGGPATAALLREPRDVASDSEGNIYIADTGNHVIRRVKKSDGTINTIVGAPRPVNAVPLFGDAVRAEDGKPANEIHLTSPTGVEIDHLGRVWIADQRNNVVRILYR